MIDIKSFTRSFILSFHILHSSHAAISPFSANTLPNFSRFVGFAKQLCNLGFPFLISSKVASCKMKSSYEDINQAPFSLCTIMAETPLGLYRGSVLGSPQKSPKVRSTLL